MTVKQAYAIAALVVLGLLLLWSPTLVAGASQGVEVIILWPEDLGLQPIDYRCGENYLLNGSITRLFWSRNPNGTDYPLGLEKQIYNALRRFRDAPYIVYSVPGRIDGRPALVIMVRLPPNSSTIQNMVDSLSAELNGTNTTIIVEYVPIPPAALAFPVNASLLDRASQIVQESRLSQGDILVIMSLKGLIVATIDARDPSQYTPERIQTIVSEIRSITEDCNSTLIIALEPLTPAHNSTITSGENHMNSQPGLGVRLLETVRYPAGGDYREAPIILGLAALVVGLIGMSYLAVSRLL